MLSTTPVQFENWSHWAIENNIDKNVLMFLQNNREYFNSSERTTPRMWWLLSKILKSEVGKKYLDEILVIWLGSTVGHQFLSFYKTNNGSNHD